MAEREEQAEVGLDANFKPRASLDIGIIEGTTKTGTTEDRFQEDWGKLQRRRSSTGSRRRSSVGDIGKQGIGQ